MSIQTIKLGNTSFVIVPEKEFRKLQSQASAAVKRDKGDVAESRRRLKEKGGTRLEDFRRKHSL